MCPPMSPFCSRLIISNYILAQKVEGRLDSGRAHSAQLSEGSRLWILVKPACRAIVKEVRPARRKYPRSARRKLMSASPVIDPALPVRGPICHRSLERF